MSCIDGKGPSKKDITELILCIYRKSNHRTDAMYLQKTWTVLADKMYDIPNNALMENLEDKDQKYILNNVLTLN